MRVAYQASPLPVPPLKGGAGRGVVCRVFRLFKFALAYSPPSTWTFGGRQASGEVTVKLLNKINAILDRTMGVLAGVAAVLIIFMLLAVATEVIIMRLLLDRPQVWVVDITSQSLLFIGFLGAAWVLKRDKHVTLDLLVTRLNPRAQVVLNTIMSIIGIVICAIVAWYGTEVTWGHFQQGVRSATYLEIPRAPLLAVIPLGSFLLSIQFLRRTIQYLKGWRGLPEKEQML